MTSMQWLSFLLGIFSIGAIVILFLVIRQVMKFKTIKYIPFKMTVSFISTVVIVSIIIIVVGSQFDVKKDKVDAQEFSRKQVAMDLSNGQENKFEPFLQDEKKYTVPKGKLEISYTGNELANYYVLESNEKDKQIRVRTYVMPVIRHGYVLEQQVEAQRVVMENQNQLIISIDESDEIKADFMLYDSNLIGNNMERFDHEYNYSQVTRFTVIEVSQGVKTYYDVSESLRSEIYE